MRFWQELTLKYYYIIVAFPSTLRVHVYAPLGTADPRAGSSSTVRPKQCETKGKKVHKFCMISQPVSRMRHRQILEIVSHRHHESGTMNEPLHRCHRVHDKDKTVATILHLHGSERFNYVRFHTQPPHKQDTAA
jgi:hypothetical protein